jgi:uncharacterized protein
VIIAISAGLGFWFGHPLVVKGAEVGATADQADLLVSRLNQSGSLGDRLAAIALSHSSENVEFDPTYYKIAYPAGDVPENKGIAADVLIRCFRKIGIDLQVAVHEDISDNFRLYPQLWGSTSPDPNIDHRRVPNLQRFFSRKGQELSPTRSASNYRPGDIVVWALADAGTHIGIVVPGPGGSVGEPWVVHNNGSGVKWENVLFQHHILGHYRYPAEGEEGLASGGRAAELAVGFTGLAQPQ